MISVTDIEILEDFTARARCDEGFLHVRRLRAQNRRSDGSVSQEYRIDCIQRPRLDAVAVLVWRRGAAGELEFFTRANLRPAAYFRKDAAHVDPQERSHLFCEEIVAGLLEVNESDETGRLFRAAEEVWEESGFRVSPKQLVSLGPPFFVAPGIISEKIYLFAVEVTGLTAGAVQGDGSPLEEGPCGQFRSQRSLREALRSGEIQDAKTELALGRFLEVGGFA
jgi:ADP-ribose pyrophosphatase